MKAAKILLLIVLLALAGILAGCNEGYTSQERTMTNIQQRADGLRIPTY
jgi:hypothetical protein